MATVWAAEDRVLGRLVAIKVLARALAADESAAKRFMREARAAAMLSGQAHVVTIYDVGEHDGQPFLVMEHYAGGTVADRIATREPIAPALSARWLEEAASGL